MQWGDGHPLMGDSIRSQADHTLEVIKVLSMELISGESFDVAYVRDVILVFVTFKVMLQIT